VAYQLIVVILPQFGYLFFNRFYYFCTIAHSIMLPVLEKTGAMKVDGTFVEELMKTITT